MNYQCSHNDYWVKPQITKALWHGCNILEVDVKLIDNEVVMTHSWRPFAFICYGRLIDYIDEIKDKNVILLIELKEGSEKLNKKLFEILEKYNHIKYLLNAKNNWMNRNRERYMIDFFNEHKQQLDIELKEIFELKNTIEYKKYYEKSLNHF